MQILGKTLTVTLNCNLYYNEDGCTEIDVFVNPDSVCYMEFLQYLLLKLDCSAQ